MTNPTYHTGNIQKPEIFIKDATLSFLFSVCSLAFSASLIGLFINLIINTSESLTHLFFLGMIFVSIISGVIINTIDKHRIRRGIQFKIDNFIRQE